jgi:hypothetical protein
VCQSCHHFQAAGFDNMGWCNHPRRRIGTDVKVFVRAQELPCRNDWDHDLWQARDATLTDVVVEAGVTPVPPASPAEIGSLAALELRGSADAGSSQGTSGGEDIVLGDVTTLATGDVSADDYRRDRFRRAHEELRLRKREQRPFLAPIGVQAAESSEAPHVADQGPPTWHRPLARPTRDVAAGQPGQRKDDVSPVELGELGRPFAQLTAMPGEDARFSSIPTREEDFDLPLANQAGAATRQAAVSAADDALIPWSTTEASIPATAYADAEYALQGADRPFEHGERSRRRQVIGRHRQRPVRSSLPAGSILATESVDDDPGTLVWEESLSAGDGRNETSGDEHAHAPIGNGRSSRGHRHETHAAWPETDVVASRVVNVDEGSPIRNHVRGTAVTESESIEVELNGGLGDEVELLLAPEEEEDLVPEMWVDVPRMCRTCRDFRPAENGDRGWCQNKWAFNHRRMVDADELPCETSVGGWWLPHDDVWMAAADVSAHSQPTPLLDQWLAARAAARGEADAVPLIRRRQR